MTEITPQDMIEWIDVQLRSYDDIPGCFRNAEKYTTLYAIRQFIASHQEVRDAALESLRIWKEAPNGRPDYVQNAVSHGCVLSARAIRALKGKP